MRSVCVLAGALVLLASCKKDPPPAPVVVAPAPVAPAPPPPPRDAGPPLTQADLQAIPHFVYDCHFVFTQTVDSPTGEQKKPECEARFYEQNCVPDPSECAAPLEQCKDACSTPCNSCQQQCAQACDGCKSKCSADGGCILECATARQLCRNECKRGLDECRDIKCEAIGRECAAKEQAQLEKDCPDCREMQKCIQAALERRSEMSQDDCQAKYPNNKPRCLDFCGYQE
ncbi:MAG: hypothetical protein QM723_32055 [Myxococcaceae bacterium]